MSIFRRFGQGSLLILTLLILAGGSAQAQTDDLTTLESPNASDTFITPAAPEHVFVLGTVTAIMTETSAENSTGALASQSLQVALKNNKVIDLDYSYLTPDDRLQPNDRVIIDIATYQEQTTYALMDRYRLPPLLAIALAFFLLVITIARRRGLSSILGLVASFIILFTLILPGIEQGSNPLMLAFGGSCLIAIVTLYLAHGFHRTTTVAVGATLITLLIAVFSAKFAVSLTHLSGLGSEEAFYLQTGSAAIGLKGLLLGGIIIGVLGILDDITTGQVAVIHQLRQANPKFNQTALYHAGLMVGKEHIASLVNTLILAYVGTALPLLLLIKINLQQQPLWIILNNQLIVEEIVRALVGSTALVLAVPIATALAVTFLNQHDNHKADGTTQPAFWEVHH